MFIRVKSKATGHEFDIHEHQFNEAKHTRVSRYPPASRPRRTKFRLPHKGAAFISPVRVEKEAGDVADNP